MTRRFTHVLATLYAIVACGLIHCAIVSYQREALHYAALFTAAAVALATAIVHHSYLRDELRFAHAQLDAATRPRATTPVEDGVQAVFATSWCCDAWAATAGADHDPKHCTRKDHHA
ncbi:hypothetical protein OG478_22955 [Streptomyces phaeochromogenes]|uniref:hypothetical protein n=1 Tax=Streptomyces phaeochromogenes TaxID=1923 RepID=UPI00386761C0|nr:hypothetical protein OG478_22955 [Streptomyces phaeochromogenes]